MLWNRRLCGVVNERQGHCLRPSSAHPPTAFHAKGPALSLSLCVSVDTSTPRGRNLSITSLRHVPGPIHSSEKRDERVVANGQRRHVDAAVVPEAEFLLRMRDAGVKMRWMDRNVSFDCSIFFSSSSSSPRDRRRGKIKLSVMSDRGKWDDRYQVSRQKRVFLSRENREIVSIF